jgi:hypothetical protein
MRRRNRFARYFIFAALLAGISAFFAIPESSRHRWLSQEHGTWKGTLTCRRAAYRPDRRPCRLIVQIEGEPYEIHETPALRTLHHEQRTAELVVTGVRQHATWLTRNEVFVSSFRPQSPSAL